MAAQIIDGKKIAAETRAEIAAAVAEQKAAGVTPGLAVIIVGENPASQVYVRNKHKACGEVGMYSEVIEMPGDTTEATLLAKIAELNVNDKIDGILVQLPLPNIELGTPPQGYFQIMLSSQQSGAVRPIILTMVGATLARP